MKAMSQSPSQPIGKHYDVCIQGSGIVGRTLALLLARERLRVALVGAPASKNAKADVRADVRAYALNTASRTLLESLRAWPEAPASTPVFGMNVQGDASGKSQGIVNFSALEQEVAALAWIVDVPALEDQLLQAVKFQPLIDIIEPSSTSDIATVSDNLQNPVTHQIRADLTVICEGRNSLTRDTLAVDFDVTPYNQHAVAARLTCEFEHDNIARQWFHNGEILAFLPLSTLNTADSTLQGNSVALVWSVSPERAAALMALSAEDFGREAALAGGQALGDMQLCSERATWPLQLARASRWVGTHATLGSWALAGDAAHSVHPLSGQGLNLGLADVAELAKVLSITEGQREYWRNVGDVKLLRRYERARKTDVLLLGSVTDGLQQLFAQGLNTDGVPIGTLPWQMLRNLGMQGFERSGGLKHWVTKRAMGL